MTDKDFAQQIGDCKGPLPKKFDIISNNRYFISKSKCKVNKDERDFECYCRKNEGYGLPDENNNFNNNNSNNNNLKFNCIADCINREISCSVDDGIAAAFVN